MEGGRSAFKMLTGKPTTKTLLGRPWFRWKDNIRIIIKEILVNMRNCVDSAQNRDYWIALVNAALPGSISHGVNYLVNGNIFYQTAE